MLTESVGAPRILIVEDNESHAELMGMALQDAAEEYRLEIAASLHDARCAMERQLPDLVLTDYRLPDGDGGELVQIACGRCPVVLLTSQGNERVAVEAMKAGAQDYVVKTSAVFTGMSRIIQRGLREWALIQEQKRAEEERHRMERHCLYIQKLESLGTMSSGIAHDFNNLLQAVLGNLEISLIKLPPDAAVRAYLVQAVTAAERAAKLSGMMLAYSGKGFFKAREVDLTGVIEKISGLLSAAVSENITLNVILGRDLPPIMADEDQIQQVVMNLAINAFEAVGSTTGTVTIANGAGMFDQETLNSSRLEEKLPAGRYVWIRVSDSGCGMDAATRDKLFDPFFTTKFTGRGLGLSAAIGIIRAHKGAILVESSPGNGTTMQVLFPVAAAVTADKECDVSAAVEPAASDIRQCGTVLIVDDEEMIRAICHEMMCELGFEAVTADSGEEALRIFREMGERIDLVLLDHSIPDMDGVAVFRELRSMKPGIPVLLASGYSEEVVADSFKGLELNAFIQKPFNLDCLRDEVRRALDRKK